MSLARGTCEIDRAPLGSASTRVLFVNAGLLGARTFGVRLFPVVAAATTLELSQILLSDDLTPAERLVRRIVCQQVWPGTVPGARNLDLVRYRQEWHTGSLARRRLRKVGRDQYDVLLFYRQPAAYGSIGLMRRVASIVAIDCTQACIRSSYSSGLERATLAPNVARDGAVFDAARAIICSSRWAADSVRHLYPRCGTPVHVMPPPVDLAAFSRGWVDERTARAREGAKARVLFVAGEFARKGGPELLRAWRATGLKDRAELHIMSRSRIDAASVPEGVILHPPAQPYSADWTEFWRKGDLFAFPTRHEAYGMVLQEAAAAGLPRIGTRENAGPELIDDGRTGVLIDSGDTGMLARALVTLVADPALRFRMGAAALDWVAETAAPAVYARALEHVVASVLSRQPAANA